MLKARDVMSRNLKEVDANAPVEVAAHLMVEEGVSSLIVVPTERDEPYGIVTTKDIVGAMAEGLDLAVVRVARIASSPLVVVSPGVPVDYVARLMQKTGLRHIAVFNGQTVIGVVSSVDLVRAVAKGIVEARVLTS